MKILVFGSDGMAGHLCFNYLKANGYEVIGTSRKKNENLNVISLSVGFL